MVLSNIGKQNLLYYYCPAITRRWPSIGAAELFTSIFRHLKLELLTLPASIAEKYFYLWEIGTLQIDYLMKLTIYRKLFYQFQ